MKEVGLLNACELTTSVTLLANTIACQLSDDELALIGAVFAQLGDTLATIAAQRALCSNICNHNSDSNNSTDSNSSAMSASSVTSASSTGRDVP